jgi:hypothetical protein
LVVGIVVVVELLVGVVDLVITSGALAPSGAVVVVVVVGATVELVDGSAVVVVEVAALLCLSALVADV